MGGSIVSYQINEKVASNKVQDKNINKIYFIDSNQVEFSQRKRSRMCQKTKHIIQIQVDCQKICKTFQIKDRAKGLITAIQGFESSVIKDQKKNFKVRCQKPSTRRKNSKNIRQEVTQPQIERKQSQEQLGRIYRQFSRQKYNKYKHQFPKLRESEIVTKIIKEWNRLQSQEKIRLREIYLNNKFITKYESDSSQVLRREDRNQRKARNTALFDAQNEEKERQPTYFHSNIRQQKQMGEDDSDFNRNSQKDESEIQLSVSYSRISKSNSKQRKIRVVRKYKSKKIQKSSDRSDKIKNSKNFQKFWQCYRTYYWPPCKPRYKKKAAFKEALHKKLKYRSKSQKIKVMERVAAENCYGSRRRNPSVSFKVVYNKKWSRFTGEQPQITLQSRSILCHSCNQLINEERSQACRKCNLIYHNQCSKKVRRQRYCVGCDYNCQPIERHVAIPQKLKITRLKINWLESSPKFIGEKLRLAKQNQEQNQRILKQRLKCEYSFFNRYSFHFTQLIIPSVNPTFPKLSEQDMRVIDMFAQSRAFPPIEIKKHQKFDGYGVFAYRDIKKHQLISTYSGAVLTHAFIEKNNTTPEYVMALFEGLSLLTKWSICPYKFSSFGPLLNCAIKPKDINVETLMCVIDQQFLILMRAKRSIKIGQELIYQYNGRLDQYNTTGFI